jgi:hypothetical protein
MSVSSRKERIELGIELTPSGSAGAVVRLVAVLVWANRLAVVAVMPTRVNLRILRLLFELACPPELVSYEPLVRMVVAEIEKHPEQLTEDFIVLASEVMMLSWACKK